MPFFPSLSVCDTWSTRYVLCIIHTLVCDMPQAQILPCWLVGFFHGLVLSNQRRGTSASNQELLLLVIVSIERGIICYTLKALRQAGTIHFLRNDMTGDDEFEPSHGLVNWEPRIALSSTSL